MSEYEKCEGYGEHSIKSNNVLVCSDTGRVVSVFYNDYDLDDVLEKLSGIESLIPKGAPMPQTISAYKKLAVRDLELIESQRDEIGRLKCKVNSLQQQRFLLK